eukprot:CAMPEP_0204520176 /NCGR_PEP_ID=MMETSP0661-20131031/5129_1 /ASSEMBLY_ACC=CAM_ASM_000606 /TAXON_ID=109239 /ORGANISM="Alexandrium margalefi, Strain AMGDE01CS-322" /LENGTH=220 /DNA_ID=CAMNT_0051525721 /DNA_START=1 /DNA_END=663 /DNA_ORIENTATION=-
MAKQKMNFAGAVVQLFDFWNGNPEAAKDVPPKLQGVFWMSDNPADEIGFTWMGVRHDALRRRFTWYPGGGCWGACCSSKYAWTYGTSSGGWMLYLVNRLPVLKFTVDWNEDYSCGEITIWALNCIPLPGVATIKQLDAKGLSWARETSNCGKPYPDGTYTVKKVIDERGERLHAFSEMERSVSSGQSFNGWKPKTAEQLIPMPLCGAPPARKAYEPLNAP